MIKEELTDLQSNNSIHNLWSSILFIAICCNLLWIFLLFLLISFQESNLLNSKNSNTNNNHNDDDNRIINYDVICRSWRRKLY